MPKKKLYSLQNVLEAFRFNGPILSKMYIFPILKNAIPCLNCAKTDIKYEQKQMTPNLSLAPHLSDVLHFGADWTLVKNILVELGGYGRFRHEKPKVIGHFFSPTVETPLNIKIQQGNATYFKRIKIDVFQR